MTEKPEETEPRPPAHQSTTIDMLVATAAMGLGLIFIGSMTVRTMGMPASARLQKNPLRGVEVLAPAPAAGPVQAHAAPGRP